MNGPARPQLDSLEAELLDRRLRARLFDEPLPSMWIDRFELETKLGAGGMGSVWLAYDHRLARRVALKFLRSHEDGSVGELRLFREAQALARLAHPHVITVFDVGRHEGRVWIAMESVSGQTLRAWAREPRSARALLDVWIDAGRGLAAIHAAGLVHRDIKPDNVLLGDDGRVRVIDFGLVRALDGSLAAARASSTSSAEASGSASTHEFVGTPAYAAPEQVEGSPTLDARADQYAYCVSVWEALVGQRPNPAELAEPPGRTMPTRVRRALARGLSHDPTDRFSDMVALLAELAPPRRAWILSSVLGVALVGTLAAGFAGVFEPDDARTPDVCAATSGPVDAVWPLARRRAIASRVGSDDAALALGIVDGWTERWREAAAQACKEVHVEQLRSEDSLDRRRACLDARLVELEVLLASLEALEHRPSREQLLTRAALLEDPSSCLRPQLLEGEADSLDPQQRERERALRAELFALEIDRDQLALPARRHAVEAVFEQARASGLRELQARAAHRLGALALLADKEQLARTWYGRALDLGEQARDPAIVATAWHGLGMLALDLQLDLAAARWAGEREHNALRELPRESPRHAYALLLRARISLTSGALDEAERHVQQALEWFTAAGLEHGWDHATALRLLALIASRRGHAARAAAALAQARMLEQGAPSDSAPVAILARSAGLHGDGIVALEAGELEAAERLLDEALALQIAQEGPRGRGVADVHLTLARLADARGDLDAIRTHAEQADAIYRETSEPRDFDRFHALTVVATVAFRERRFAEASRAYARALEIAEHHLEPGAPELALAHANLGEALTAAGQPRQGEAHLRRGLADLTAALGPDALEVAVASKALAITLLELGDAATARELLERSLAIHGGQATVEQAETRRALAQALAALGEPSDSP